MEKVLADAFLNFYQKMLKPEFDEIKGKQAEHDERFGEGIAHFDSLYQQLGKLDDEHLVMIHQLERIEKSLESGGAKRAELENEV